jgi:hypothetical protein
MTSRCKRRGLDAPNCRWGCVLMQGTNKLEYFPTNEGRTNPQASELLQVDRVHVANCCGHLWYWNATRVFKVSDLKERRQKQKMRRITFPQCISSSFVGLASDRIARRMSDLALISDIVPHSIHQLSMNLEIAKEGRRRIFHAFYPTSRKHDMHAIHCRWHRLKMPLRNDWRGP